MVNPDAQRPRQGMSYFAGVRVPFLPEFGF